MRALLLIGLASVIGCQATTESKPAGAKGIKDFDPVELVKRDIDKNTGMNTWSPCWQDICKPFIPYRPLKAACVTGCRVALSGGIDNAEQCEEYCTGVIDHPWVVEWGEKVEDDDSREQWLAVCQKGCSDGQAIRTRFEKNVMEAELGQ